MSRPKSATEMEFEDTDEIQDDLDDSNMDDAEKEEEQSKQEEAAPLIYDAIPKEELIQIRTKQGLKEYRLQEPDGTQRDLYMDTLRTMARIDRGTGKPIGVKTNVGLQASLIILCMFDVAANKAVDKNTVQSWPARMRDSIWERCAKIAGLDELAKKTSKND